MNPPTDLVCIQGMRLLHLRTACVPHIVARAVTVCVALGATLSSPPPLVAQGAPLAPGAVRWPVRTLPHVDLWLHALALVSDDSSTVPLFRRHYRDSLTVEKNRRNINADDKLKPVFGGKKQVNMFEMTKLVSKHLKQD